MATPVPPGLRLGAAEPVEAVAAFQARGLLAPTFNWHDIWQAEHARAFMVAGVAQADVLRLIRDSLREPLATGKSLADFARELRPQLQARGWWGDVEIADPRTGELRITRFDGARLKLIYDTNLRQSYAAGRWARIERAQARQPYVMYRTMRDERVRASHAQWDSLALPVDDPFWRQHYPPNGWRCRCTAFSLSASDLERRRARGEPIKTEPPPAVEVPYVDPRTGETATAPLGVDPAFAYNPGQALLQQAGQLQRRALDTAPPADGQALLRQQLASPNFARFLREPAAGEVLPVARLGARQARQMRVGGHLVMTEDSVRAQRAAQPELAAGDYATWLQAALDSGAPVADGAELVWLVEQGGSLAVVRARRAAIDGRPMLELVSLRRMPAGQAAEDAEVLRLRARGNG